MPAQLSESAKEVQETIEGASNGAKAVMAGNFLLAIVLSASLNQLLALINTQQLIVMMPLFTATLPANAGMFFAKMMEIAAFELFDTKPYLDKYLGLAPSEPLNSNFEAVGFESVYVLHNMGTLVLAFFYYLFLVMFSYLLKCTTNYKVTHFREKLQRKLFWSSFIKLMFESYSISTVSCLINLRFLSWDAWNTGMMSTLALLMTSFLLLFIVFIGTYTSQNFDALPFRSVKSKYGTIYSDLNLRNGKSVLLQPVWFLVRRFILAMIVVFLRTTVIW